YNLFVTKDSEGLPKFARAWKAGPPGNQVYLGYAGRGRWGWQGVGAAEGLLATVQLLERHLGVPVEWSSGHMGTALLKLLWQKKPGMILDVARDLRDLPFGLAARDILFRRALTTAMIGMTLHVYDKNSAYLSACRGLARMGVGEPSHLVAREGGEPIRPGLPGIYRVTLRDAGWRDACFDGELLPPLLEEGQEWITNDLLLYVLGRGMPLHLHEAWVFRDYAPILDKWAKTLWDARARLRLAMATFPQRQAERDAYATVGEIAHVSVGGFAASKEVHPSRRMIHPNWWADVVSKARINQLCNLESLAAGAGAPVLVYSDGVYYASRDPNPHSAVPGILDRQAELGGYKHVYSLPISAALVWASEGLTPSELVALFRQEAARHES
ncbi:MAG TPA: hypothetical protein VGT44_06365, partial [Ktedonobacteraceae bacterium]|nr:hypothetical protein [Ktedonobacteraceae bacterium]